MLLNPVQTSLSLLEKRILETLKLEDHLTTKELSEKLGETREKTYRSCQTLKLDGRIESSVIKRKKAFIFPVTGEIIHKQNHNRYGIIKQKILNLLENYFSNPTTLENKIIKYLEELALQKDLSAFWAEIMSFKRLMMNAIHSGKTKAVLIRMLDLRSFGIKECIWHLLPTGMKLLKAA